MSNTALVGHILFATVISIAGALQMIPGIRNRFPVFHRWNGRLFVRAKGDPYLMVPAITRTIHEMSTDQPVERASTLGDARAEILTPDKLNAIVFGGFAAALRLFPGKQEPRRQQA